MVVCCGSFLSCWTLIVIFSCTSHGLTMKEGLRNRIINGTKARDAQFTYMVSVRINGEHYCGGTLHNAWWVLTAAHCVPRESSKLSVLAGSATLSQSIHKGIVVNVSEVIPHSQFVPRNNFANDIALLKLSSPIVRTKEMPNVKYVLLPPINFEIPPETLTQVIGWGFTKTGEYDPSDDLLYAQIPTLSNERCQELHREIAELDSSQLCAGLKKGGEGQCSGDSGGPLMWDDYQIGIVSWSQKPCASENHPGVFTRISSYRNWIIEVEKQHSQQIRTRVDESYKSVLIFN